MFTDNELRILENLIQHEVTFFSENKLQGFDAELTAHSILLDKITLLRRTLMEFQCYETTERTEIKQQYRDATNLVTISRVTVYDGCYHEYYYKVVFMVRGKLNHISCEGNAERAFTLYHGIVDMV
ncbi:hypothetical protein LCGC14_2908420 [marine sediment metagenome]|uniref:Uncharacterized protein n=1 Tax=marine sediment metagenome TaxID=412755 RepID=A0A0F8XSR8_9ZZZZ